MFGEPQPVIRLVSRRRLLRRAAAASMGVLALACAPAAPAPTSAPAPTKPSEAAKPAPAAAPSPSPAASPSPSPAASPSPSPAAAAPAAAAAAKPLALPNLSGTTLTVLQWSSFIPEADPFFKKQIEDDFMKQTGGRVNIEFVNADDLQPKINAAVQSGAGPDVILFQYNWQHIYKDAVVDVTDIAEEVKRSTGDFWPQIETAIKVDGKYLAVPHDLVPNAMHWRRSWFKEAGSERFPESYAQLHEVGKRLKAAGRPIGQALSHAFGDPPTWAYPLLWAFGGGEVDDKGKVIINSAETLAAVRWQKDAWKDAFDEGGFSYDGAGNNRAFLAGTISATLNGASIWWVMRRDKHAAFDDVGLDLLPAGPKGSYQFAVNNNYAIMKYSKNVDAAKAFIRWTMQDSVWMPWFEANGSYVNGVGARQDNNPIWDKFDPAVRIFKGVGARTRAPGWPGPFDQKAGLAQSKYIVVDMFAKAAGGDSAESAVAWAEQEYKAIYGS